MSPEQATGDREVDGRSDIYSLACVLYEMLAGEPPHTGPTVQAVIAKVVTDRPRSIAELRDTVPNQVAASLHKALAKLPADRFVSVSEFRAALGESVFPAAVPAISSDGSKTRFRLTTVLSFAGWFVAAVLLAVVVFARQSVDVDGADPGVLHLSIPLPDSAPLAFTGPSPIGVWQRALAVSHDGETIVYVAPWESTTRLYIRHLGRRTIEPLPGTEGAFNPFFSPDGQWIGFFTGRELKKVHVLGEQTVPLAQDLTLPVGASWLDDGRIFVADNEGVVAKWIPAAGGVAEVFDTLSAPFQDPVVLPGHRWAVGTSQYNGVLAAVSLDDGSMYAITRDGLRSEPVEPEYRLVGYNPVYSESGHILYLSISDGVLMALPFDPERAEVLGEPAPVLGGVRKEATFGFGHVGISDFGTLYYAPGGNADIGRLALVSPDGNVDTLDFPAAPYEQLHLSPDGQRAAVAIRSELGPRTTRVLDLGRAQQEPVRVPGRPNGWLPRGDGLVLSQRDETRLSPFDALDKVAYYFADGSTQTLGLEEADWVDLPQNADLIAWNTHGGFRMFVAPFGREGQAIRMPELGAQVSLSPNGDWLAYLRVGEGYVELSPFPPTGSVFKVSDASGELPKWTLAGDRIVYKSGKQFFEVDFRPGSVQLLGTPRLIAEGPFVRVWGATYDLTPDGRLLVLLGSPEQSTDRINVVTNFFSVLDSLAPRR